jgi:thiamine transporter ThiT
MTFTTAFLWRLSMHVISGVLYFEVDWLGSLIYNIAYLLPSFLISLIVIITLYFSNLPLVIRNLTTQKML